MEIEAPVILIASVAPCDGHALELTLKRTGWDLCRVDDAAQAARQLDGGGRRAVLVIDSGLLEMAHDAQWRALREHHPELGTVVRCLVPEAGALHKTHGRTLAVHPDDVDGVCRAVQAFGAPGLLPH